MSLTDKWKNRARVNWLKHRLKRAYDNWRRVMRDYDAGLQLVSEMSPRAQRAQSRMRGYRTELEKLGETVPKFPWEE